MNNKKLTINFKHHPCQKSESYVPLIYLDNFWKILTDFNGFPAYIITENELILFLKDLNKN